ncbi:MAG: tetratricopeptide repeat protein [Chryseobacterium sp.]|nr:MAG: tetratricopeptide repeat protein [Chryseobacterium sp.]
MAEREIVKRKTPSKETLSRIFAVSGNQCAFPDCEHPLFDEDYDFIAQVCHIEAAMPLGERFNENQTNEQRCSFENLLALCHRHHVKTNNVEKYPTPVLQAMKADHEAKFHHPSNFFSLSNEHLEQVHGRLERMYQDIQIIKKDASEIKGIVTDNSFKLDELLRLHKANLGENHKLQDEYKRQLTLAFSQMELGHPSIALQQLVSLKSAIWNEADDELKFKIETNIGYCYHILQNDTQAAHSLIRAYDFQQDSETSLSNITNAYIILNREDVAFSFLEKYQKSYPDSIYMFSLWIRFNALRLSIEDILKIVPASMHGRSEVLLSLGVAAKRKDNLTLALAYFKEAFELNPQDNFTKQHLLQAHLEIISINFALVNLRIMSSEERANIDTVLSLINEQLEQLRDAELGKLRSKLLMARGYLYGLLDEFKAAMDDFDSAVESDLDNFMLSKHKGMLLLRQRRFAEALTEFGKISDFSSMPDLPAIMAEIYHKLGRGKEGVELLKKFIQHAEDSYFKPQSIHVLLDLYINEDLKDDVELLLQDNFKSNTILDKVSLCRANWYLGHAEVAKDILMQGFNQVDEKSTFKELFFLGEELAKHKYYLQAISLYERIVVAGTESEPNVKLYRLYHLVGRVDKALSILKEIRIANGPTCQSTGFEVNLYQELGDYTHAIEVAEEFLNVFSSDADMRLILSGLYLREGREQDAEHILLNKEGIDLLSINAISSYIAQLNELGKKDLIYAFIYDFSRSREDKASTELYLQTFLQFPLDTVTRKSEAVGLGSAVGIETNLGDTFTIILEDKPLEQLKTDEVASGQDRFNRLLNRKIGDIIPINSIRSWKVIEIETKYRFWFRECKRKIDTLFSDSSRLHSYRLENMQEVIGRLASQDGGYFRDYHLHLKACHDGKIPFGVISERFDKNPIDVYLEMKAMGLSLLSSSGTPKNDSNRYAEILDGKILCADLTALLHIYQLDIAEELLCAFGKIFISNSTLDVIFDAVSDSRNFKADNEPAPFYQGLLAFTKKIATAVFPENLLAVNANEYQMKGQLVGKSFLDSIYLCDQKQAVLLSDDFFFSVNIAYSSKVESMWTQAVLFHLTSIGALSLEHYFQKCVMLASLSYRHCSVNAMILLSAYKGFEGMPKSGFESCKRMLYGDQSTLHSAAGVVFVFVRQIAKDATIALTDLDQVCYQLILALMSGRVVIDVIRELQNRFLSPDSVFSTKSERLTVGVVGRALDQFLNNFIF